MPVTGFKARRIFYPHTAANCVLAPCERRGEIEVGSEAGAITLVVSVAVGLHGDSAGAVAKWVALRACAPVGEGDRRYAAGVWRQGLAGSVYEVNRTDKTATDNGQIATYFVFWTAVIIY